MTSLAEMCGTATGLAPTTILALRAQAQADLSAGRLRQAEQALQLILRDAPNDIAAGYALGLVALQAGNAGAAATLLIGAAAQQPGNPEVQYNAAVALVMLQRFAEAERYLRRALELNPQLGPAWNNLGNILKAFGEVDEAYACFERAAALSPGDAVRQSHQLICAHYSRRITHAQMFQLHLRWAEIYASAFYPRFARPMRDPDPERALNLGLVSPSFDGKIVGQFLRGVLPALRETGLRLHAYSATTETDSVTLALRENVHAWRDISRMDDDAASRLIESDQIDILVDLAGHAPGNRLLLFARKPAPIQIAWLDYFDTTGLATMDYLVTDRRTTPEDSPQQFSESLLRLPESRLCWTPPDFVPAVTLPPCQRNGYVTFGSFNRADKLNPELLVSWAEILRRVPGARLLLKGVAFAMPEVRAHFGERFAALGVSLERIEWRGPSNHEQLLAEYADVDLALDTSPYNGGATTCDALWMGVPVIARREERMISRQSAAMLDCVGLGDLVADSPDQYVALAAKLAGDPERLASLRAGLRPAMARSALCDASRFARDFATALREVWRSRCQESFVS